MKQPNPKITLLTLNLLLIISSSNVNAMSSGSVHAQARQAFEALGDLGGYPWGSTSPILAAGAPGRVNLIGEHTVRALT